MTTADQALVKLRDALDSGAFPPGGRLPAERALAGQLGLGRGTLRKALEALAREGRIRRRVGEGTFVTDTPAALLRLEAAPSPADVLEARRMLEPAIAAAAALRARGPEIAALRALTEKPVAGGPTGGDWRAWEDRDTAFHAAVATAAGNPLLSALLDTLHEMRRREDWGRLRRQTVTLARQRLYARQHQAVAAAIAARDPGAAAEAMRVHLIAVEAAMTGTTPTEAEAMAVAVKGAADVR